MPPSQWVRPALLSPGRRPVGRRAAPVAQHRRAGRASTMARRGYSAPRRNLAPLGTRRRGAQRMPGGWRRTGLTTAAAPSRAAWLAAGNGWNAPARQGRPAVARRVFGGDRSIPCLAQTTESRRWIRAEQPFGRGLDTSQWRKSTAPAMGESVPRSSSSARCWACDRIDVGRQAHERGQRRGGAAPVPTPPTVARRGPSSRDILNGSSMWPELAGGGGRRCGALDAARRIRTRRAFACIVVRSWLFPAPAAARCSRQAAGSARNVGARLAQRRARLVIPRRMSVSRSRLCGAPSRVSASR